MSGFILDTDHITLYQAAHPIVQRRVNALDDTQLFVTIVSYQEQTSGWLAQIARAQATPKVIRMYQWLQETLQYFAKQRVLPFDERAAQYVQQFQQQRIRVGTRDLRIAAIALANRCTIVTRNRRDFERVPGLPVEDWSVAATE
jgi:tRNA(fMet)-specific endonuclease VapC